MAGNQQAQLSAFAKDLNKLDSLTIKTVPIPEPKEGEVLAKILLAPVNPTDVHQLEGVRPIGHKEFPQVGGTEGKPLIQQFKLVLDHSMHACPRI